jgi:uncharacterized protein involved in exopolysaccharide biosynthesis
MNRKVDIPEKIYEKNELEDGNFKVSQQKSQSMIIKNDKLDFENIARIISNEKRLLILITLVTTLFGILYTELVKPIYRSSVLLAPVSEDETSSFSGIAGQLGGLASIAGINIAGSGTNVDEAVALLKSRALTEGFIIDNNLLPALFPDKWNHKTQEWIDRSTGEVPTLWKAFKKFDAEIRTVSESKTTGLVTLSIDWLDPKVASIWARQLVNRANQQMRDRAISDAYKSLDYLEAELIKTSSVEIKNAIYGLIENQIKTAMIANVRNEYSFRIIDPPSMPDLDDPIKPNKIIIIFLSFFIGGRLGYLQYL